MDDGTLEPGTGVGMTVGQWLVERGVLTEPRAAGRPCVPAPNLLLGQG